MSTSDTPISNVGSMKFRFDNCDHLTRNEISLLFEEIGAGRQRIAELEAQLHETRRRSDMLVEALRLSSQPAYEREGAEIQAWCAKLVAEYDAMRAIESLLQEKP